MRTQFCSFVCLFLSFFLCEEGYFSQHRDYVVAGEQVSIAGGTAVIFLRSTGSMWGLEMTQNRM